MQHTDYEINHSCCFNVSYKRPAMWLSSLPSYDMSVLKSNSLFRNMTVIEQKNCLSSASSTSSAKNELIQGKESFPPQTADI